MDRTGAVHDEPVVILCGGQGTRLREITERVPKPLVDVGGKPILWHIMKIYSHHGYRRFVLCLGYKGWLIKEFFLRYREHLCDFTLRMNGEHQATFHNRVADEDWEITFVETGELTATAGRLRAVRDYIDTDEFMLTYGDGVGEIDITRLSGLHRSNGRIATVTGVRPTSRYGEMMTQGETVVEFNEKPPVAEGMVSGGFFVFDQRVFDYIDDDPSQMLEHAPLQKLARNGELSVFRHDGFWRGMDTYRDWQELDGLWNDGRAPWKVW